MSEFVFYTDLLYCLSKQLYNFILTEKRWVNKAEDKIFSVWKIEKGRKKLNRNMKIFISAKPASREDRVEKIDETHFTVRVTEPPVQGRANRAITKLLAEYFGTSVSNIKIISGFTSKQKIVEVQNI